MQRNKSLKVMLMTYIVRSETEFDGTSFRYSFY